MELVKDAGLLGAQLSRHHASLAFAASLEVKEDAKPILQPGAQFEEAVVRLCRAFVPSSGRKESPRVVRSSPKAAPPPAASDDDDTPLADEAELIEKITFVCGKLAALLAHLKEQHE
mmetsp:Transcript_49707/g.146603  ORF Transcript_49707/g.146603 Transcript_49707/m.146603 type:complete len:117 (-) Transcript_49707:70-420(-)